MFTAEEGADMHCQMGNLALSNAVVYDWLAEVFWLGRVPINPAYCV